MTDCQLSCCSILTGVLRTVAWRAALALQAVLEMSISGLTHVSAVPAASTDDARDFTSLARHAPPRAVSTDSEDDYRQESTAGTGGCGCAQVLTTARSLSMFCAIARSSRTDAESGPVLRGTQGTDPHAEAAKRRAHASLGNGMNRMHPACSQSKRKRA